MLIRSGRQENAQVIAERTLSLYRSLGDREGEGNAINSLALTQADLAAAMRYTKQALAAFEAAGSLERQSTARMNLAYEYMQLGLYARARSDLETVAAWQRKMQVNQALMYTIDNLSSALPRSGRNQPGGCPVGRSIGAGTTKRLSAG